MNELDQIYTSKMRTDALRMLRGALQSVLSSRQTPHLDLHYALGVLHLAECGHLLTREEIDAVRVAILAPSEDAARQARRALEILS